ncbi:MAG: sialidase family protein [Planctomycetota bacterium]
MPEANDLSGPPRCEAFDIFDSQRFPNLVTTTDGAVLATWGADELLSRRSTDGGATWEPAVTIGPGLQAGGTLVDESGGDVLAFAHPEHPPHKDRERFARRTMYRSTDGGRSWRSEDATYHADVNGHVPALHYAEHGIALQYGRHAGRLLRPARVYGKADGYNTAVYSDDHGRTWQAGAPFPVFGTGEGAIAERRDGTLYYSSRKHYFEEDEPRRAERLHAVSRDGGHTWVEPAYHKNLPDGPRYRGAEKRAACWNGHFGMAGGLTRLPVPDRDIFIYSNADQPEHTRHRMTLWASFDGGRTWPVKRRVDEGPGAYSSLTAGRPGTPGAGWIYLLFERWLDRPGRIGPDSAGRFVRCNLSWILGGEPTGDGRVPDDIEAPGVA